MTKTTNYELNIVEGSDKVNPLVVDNPNYEKIDEVMKKNADSGISTATELKTGTVHALTRVNSDSPVFRFVATSLFTTGDTFTVDGVQVTALLTDGTPLVTGCYVIGANVLCCLTGTTLSVYVAQNLSAMTAYDSERLGGHEADYFGTADAVATAQNTAENSNEIAMALKNELTVANKTVTADTTKVSEGSYNFKAYGHVACFNVTDIKATLTAGSNVGVFKLDEDFVPAQKSTYMTTGYTTSGSFIPILLTITKSGVNMTPLNWNGSYQTAVVYLSFTATWIV